MFQDLSEFFGCQKLVKRFYGPNPQEPRHDFVGIFPEEGAKELRFAINFFTAVGLGAMTEIMRDRLKEINTANDVESEISDKEEIVDEEIVEEASLTRLSSRMAVTAALMVVEARKFWEVDGFDEVHFPVTLNDIDLCLKLDKDGYRTIYEPQACAYHLEGVSRGLDISQKNRSRRAQEIQNFRKKWAHIFDADLWLSPAYSRGHERLMLR